MATEYPGIFRVRQSFERPRVQDVAGEVESQLAALALGGTVKPRQNVAITAGSRGIANIKVIIRAIADHVKRLGAAPFIVTAMGSHGGGTAEGQVEVIQSYGITEEYCGCPIRSGMETVVVADAAEGFPVHFDRHAYDADHVIVCGRVKPHTHFSGDLESGLMKMLLIGLGKHEGAKIYHRAIKDYSFGQIVCSVAEEVLARCRIVAGLAIVENGFDEIARIEAVVPNEFEVRDKALLLQARKLMPRLPFNLADVLLIDEVGKDISGTSGDGVGAMAPLDFPNDQEMLDAVLPLSGLTPPAKTKLMWIHNTLDLAEVECSQTYLNQARDRNDLEILTEVRPLKFDGTGMLSNVTHLIARRRSGQLSVGLPRDR